MWYVLSFIIGVVVGVTITMFINHKQQQNYRKEMEKTQGDLESRFAALSRDALKENSTAFLTLANEILSRQTQAGGMELENKKKLIDQTLEAIKTDLNKVETVVNSYKTESATKFGDVGAHLSNAVAETLRLRDTTNKLQAALDNPIMHGSWGEIEAEKVIEVIGLREGFDYDKQKTQVGKRPDFTFYVRRNPDLIVNMDAKFPWEHYKDTFNADSDNEKENFKKLFLSDVRGMINDVSTKEGYINPPNTVDYALLFIPVESVFCPLNAWDDKLMEEALKRKVILCSPLTLYAILAVINQATRNYSMQVNIKKIMQEFNEFDKQWDTYKKCMDKIGKLIKNTEEEYNDLVGVRTRKIDSQLAKIETLREEQATPDVTPVISGTIPLKEFDGEHEK